jgi:hypothetical protein
VIEVNRVGCQIVVLGQLLDVLGRIDIVGIDLEPHHVVSDGFKGWDITDLAFGKLISHLDRPQA